MQSQRDELYQAVCDRLAGKPVIWRFADPILAGALGIAYLNSAGKACIDIKPQLPESRALWVTLHELAHVRLGHAIKMPALLAGRTQPLPLNSAAFGYMRKLPREAEADSQAAAWRNDSRRLRPKRRHSGRKPMQPWTLAGQPCASKPKPWTPARRKLKKRPGRVGILPG